MKKNMFKKLICTALTAVCVITSVVPTFAEDIVTTTEAATTKSVTSAYKYHLEGFDKKRKSSELFKNFLLQRPEFVANHWYGENNNQCSCSNQQSEVFDKRKG